MLCHYDWNREVESNNSAIMACILKFVDILVIKKSGTGHMSANLT